MSILSQQRHPGANVGNDAVIRPSHSDASRSSGGMIWNEDSPGSTNREETTLDLDQIDLCNSKRPAGSEALPDLQTSSIPRMPASSIKRLTRPCSPGSCPTYPSSTAADLGNLFNTDAPASSYDRNFVGGTVVVSSGSGSFPTWGRKSNAKDLAERSDVTEVGMALQFLLVIMG